MKRLIVTADDFGASVEINEAVERAHSKGILTTTSLMVGAPAAADAVLRAKRSPTLKVGLHIVLVCGRPSLDPAQIPALVDAKGRFTNDLVGAGVNFFFRPSAHHQLEAEVRAQFEAFKKTGLELDHVNAHNHMHLHPTVARVILEVGKNYGLRAIRLPYEPINGLKNWRTPKHFVASLCLGIWAKLLKVRLDRYRVHYNDYLFGLHDNGHMDKSKVSAILDHLPAGTSEIYFHPATARHGQPFPTHYRPDLEFDALVDDEIVQSIKSRNIRLVSFSELT